MSETESPPVRTLRLPLSPHLLSELPSDGAPLIALAPGGAKNVLRDDSLRRWPVQQYVTLCKALLAKKINVVILGAPTDEWACRQFSGLQVIDLVGKTELKDIIAILNRCDAIVSHDSGLLHLSVLADCRSVALYGPTNPFETGPRGNLSKVIWGGEGLPCRPCYNGKTFAACQANICMSGIDVDSVLDAVMEILTQSRV